jgi:hypothetical protein
MERLFKLSKQCKRCKIAYENPEKNFTVNRATSDGLKIWCKSCVKKYKKDYGNTENGYLKNLYQHMIHRFKKPEIKKLNEIEKQRYMCHITEKEFRELWEEHKKQFGLRCKLTGVKMVLEQSKKKECGTHTRGYSNGMSVDRLDPNRGYTKDNIVFICNEINRIKNGVTKELCIKILEVMKERNL